MLRKLSLLPFLAISMISFSQRGKHSSYTVTSTNTQLNTYTAVTADIASGATSITVANNAMTSSFFTAALGQGDLVMIIQMQGASMSIDPTPSTSWGQDYTFPIGHAADWTTNINIWGEITAYNNAGLYEVREVRSVSSTTGITLNCALSNSYTAAGHVQVVRIPRLTNLTINANTSIVPALWDGTIGGIVALEVDGTTTFNTGSKISASGFGFRGGVTDNTTDGSPPGSASNVGFPGSFTSSHGAEKGEGIGGFTTEYNALYSRYCKGAPANGGGGGNNHNAGGGGGSNVGTGTYYGYGVPNPTYATAWNLESSGMSSAPSSGGGRGGYSYATTNQNELSVGPNNTAWSGDYRRNEGGYGGHPLTQVAGRLFMGGGGGAGDMNGSQGGNGARGGGIVFMYQYGAVSGPATIEANGANGQNSNPGGLTATTTSGTKYGNDGAGGAGGAGAILISNGSALPNTIALTANGGKGGDQALSYGQFASGPGNECDGPGGGGSGGQISVANLGTATQSLTGGASGIVTTTTYPNPNFVVNFPPNGATGGAAGIATSTGFFDINASNVSICSGNSTTLTATVSGALPVGVNVTWYSAQYGGSALGTGLTYTTPTLSTTTTYYVGTCPGTFRKPVTVTVGGPTITGTATVTNATCTTQGSITGLSTSGGVPTVTITWNGVVTPTMNLSNASAGTYTVTVTDGIGCTATSGPYTIGSTGGPSINTTNMVVTNANCTGNTGSITGITATGTGLMPSWSNGPTTLDNTGLAAGNYTLTVTDNNGCTATAGPITVGSTSGPVINSSGLTVTNETCTAANGAINGITATGTGLTYSWNGTTTPTANYTGLSAGNYTLTVTDNLGCTATYGPVNITNAAGPTLDLTNQVNTNPSCGNPNGSITGIQIVGGTPNYTISWNSGAYSTLNISSLPAGNYTLSVSDANGCPATAGPFTLTNVAGPVIDASGIVITNTTCGANNGSITGITVTGTGLNFLWSNGQNTLDILGLPAGNYGLLVTDGNGCNAVAGPFTVGATPVPVINASSLTVTNESCSSVNGAITGITATGNGLTYSWNGNNTVTLDTMDLAAGSYTLTVTDNIGCTATYGPVTVTNSPPPVLDLTNQVNVNEHCGQADGSITGIQITGGTPNYTISWNSGAYNTLDISNLPAGTYSLLVTDANNCTATAGPFTLTNVSGPVINTTNIVITNESCAGNDGAIGGITVTGTGLTYQWNGTASPLNLINKPAGSYTLVVTDNFGCTATVGPYIIGGSTPMSIDSTNLVITPAGCTVDAGAIEGLAIVGGVNPSFTWSNGSPTLDNTGLATGNYTLSVTDDQNCSITTNFYVGVTPPPMISTASVQYDTVHCGQTDGGISNIVVTDGTEPYSYKWDNNSSLNTLNLTNTTAGNHTLLVTDAMGCTATTTLTIPSQPGPVINASNLVVTNSTCQQPNGAINGLSITGSQPITYSWVGSGLTSSDLTGLMAGTYTLTATDAFGCATSSAPIVITTTPLPIADFSYSPTMIVPGTTVTFTDESTGAPITTWHWGTEGMSIGNSSTATHVYATEGNYTVVLVVETAAGCSDTITKILSVFGELLIPNVVTRNGDGVNDVFEIKNLKPNTKLYVQNRWGNLVYTSDNYLNDWKGIDKAGEQLVEGVYFYQLITDDGKILQGNVYLLNQ